VKYPRVSYTDLDNLICKKSEEEVHSEAEGGEHSEDQRAHLRRNIRLYVTLCPIISCRFMEKRANAIDLILTVLYNDQKTHSINQKID
jgi:hypothetical protein